MGDAAVKHVVILSPLEICSVGRSERGTRWSIFNFVYITDVLKLWYGTTHNLGETCLCLSTVIEVHWAIDFF
jgi:hypothetical protein